MNITEQIASYRTNPSPEGLRSILQSCQDTVYNLCYQVLRHAQDAEDASQKTLLEVARALPRIQDATHLRRWVHRVSFHVALNARKKERIRMDYERRKAAQAPGSVQPSEEQQALIEHLGRLDEEHRSLLVDHFIERRPLAELAAENGVSTAGLWKRIEKAKEELRRALAHAGLATLMPRMEALFGELVAVSAPARLLNRVVSAHAAGAATGGLVVAGIALKTKTLATGAVLSLAALLLVVVGVRSRKAEAPGIEEPKVAGPRSAPPIPPEKPRAEAPRREAKPAAVAAPPAEPVHHFDTFQEFARALAEASGIVDGLARAKAIRRTGVPLSESDLALVSAQTKAKPGSKEFVQRILDPLLGRWVELDAKGMLEFIRKFSDADPYLAGFFARWAIRAPRDAGAWAKSLPDSEIKTTLVQYAEQVIDPSASAAAALALPQGPERQAAMHRLLTSWAYTDPRAAAEWIRQALPHDEGDPLIVYAVLPAWSRSSVRAAYEWVDRSYPQGPDRAGLADMVLTAGADVNPSEAARLLLTLPGDHRELASVICATWAKVDAEAAAVWVRKAPFSEADRQKLLEAIAESAKSN
ncbi:MAG TPA: RNA polymerase sigma factor [Planctomycetota bacterium]|nr:RNA polymerase sigma factor [Planctomycetota bacterium]